MPDSPASDGSHDSENEQDGGNNQNKIPALKDKECQYCHQKFTSSSLGRHLDQFIHKKKPDGIHIVDDIRKSRGAITRRTARGSKKDQDGDSSQHGSPTPKPQEPVTRVIISDDKALNRHPGAGDVKFNKLNWQATGVITDPTALNAIPTIMRSAATDANTTGIKRNFTTYSQDVTSASAGPPETARALELALREVLDSLRAANKNASPKPSPFSFDIQSQTFPSLCLLMLPPPATLFQSSPFSTLQSIPISAPGPDQVAPLRQKLTSTIDEWKWESLRLAQPTTSNIADEADFLSQSAQQFTDSTLSHLETSFQNWMIHPYEVRNALWCVELLRAYKSEQDRNAVIEDRVQRLQQEANQLQQQVEYLSKCQWPREMALYPPKRRTFNKEMRHELRLMNLVRKSGSMSHDRTRSSSPSDSSDSRAGSGVASRGDKWDFDVLVSKWKAHVREDRNRRGPAGTQGVPVSQVLNNPLYSIRSSVDAQNTPDGRQTQSENGVTAPTAPNSNHNTNHVNSGGSSMRDALNGSLMNRLERPSSAAASRSLGASPGPTYPNSGGFPASLNRHHSQSGDDGTDRENGHTTEDGRDGTRDKGLENQNDRERDKRKSTRPASGPRPMKVQIISDW